MRDLGEHRLKDLDAPERLFQLVVDGLPADFPPPRTLDAADQPARPARRRFVGRGREVDEVVGCWRESRLVTLTGPGGTGKTRLALAGRRRGCATSSAAACCFVDLVAR